MRYPVLLRKRTEGAYVALAPVAPDCLAEGRTRDEALVRLRTLLEDRLVDTELTTIDIPGPDSSDGDDENAWLATAGVFADDPLLEPLLQDIYAARDAERPPR